jgi:hypothetical protein
MRLFTVLGVVLLMITLAACGGDTTTATPAPVETPVVEAPAASDLPALTETVTSTTNNVTVSYPAGWLEPVADVGVFLYNNAEGQSILNFMRARPGGMAFQINSQPNSSDRTPAELFEFTFSPLVSGLGMTLPEPETMTIDGVEVLHATAANTSAGSELGLFLALKPTSDGGFATFIVYLPPDEIDTQTPLIEAILATVDVQDA